MLESIKNLLEMSVRINEFDKINHADYQHLASIVTAYSTLKTAAEIVTAQASQKTSGEKERAVEQKSVLRTAIRSKMKDFSRTARAINLNDAGFQQLFRLPVGNSDQTLIANAREFIAKATEHQTEFAALGVAESLIQDLESETNALEKAISDKSAAQSKATGATAEIDKQVEIIMEARTRINAAMQNIYRNNPTKLAEWTKAKHITRAKRQSQEQPTNNG